MFTHLATHYLAKWYGATVLFTISGLVLIVVAVNIAGSVDDLSGSTDSALWTALQLSFYSSVDFFYQVLPIAIFLGALIVSTGFARSGELLALQAAGMGPKYTLPAVLGVAFVCSLLGALVAEYIAPAARIEVERISREKMDSTGDKLMHFYNRRNQWFQDGPQVLYLPSVDLNTRTFRSPAIYRFKEGELQQVIEAKRLLYEGDSWWLLQAETRDLVMGTLSRSPRLAINITQAPEDLIDITGHPQQMQHAALTQLISRRTSAGFDTAGHQIEIYLRVAYPFLGFFLVFLALPWILDPSRRRQLSVTLGAGVVVIGLVLFLSQVMRFLALAHKIPPSLGGWGPNLICLSLTPLTLWLAKRRGL